MEYSYPSWENVVDSDSDVPEPGPASFQWITEHEVEDDSIFTLQSDSAKEYDSNDMYNFDNDVIDIQDFTSLLEETDVDKDLKLGYDETGPETHPCSLCQGGKHLSSADEAIEHIFGLHFRTHGSLCSICETKLSNEQSLKKHIKGVHFRLDEMECPYCPKIIQQRSHLNRHIRSIHKTKKVLDGTEETYQCDVCNRKFFESGRRDKHVQDAHLNKLTSPLKSNHVSPTADTGVRGFACPECSKMCSSKIHLDSHLSQHSKENRSVGYGHLDENDELMLGRDLDCKICGKLLPTLEAKKVHMRTVHQNMKSFSCGLCDLRVWSSLHLKAHLRLHTNEKSIGKRKDDIICDYCNQSFESNEKLLNHVEELHAYQCPECPRHFQTTSGLSKHYKNAHIKKDLKCCYSCGMCFKTKDELNSHVELKHKIRPNSTISIIKQYVPHQNTSPRSSESSSTYAPNQVQIDIPSSCSFCSCNVTFHSVHDFNRHVQESHPFKCPICPQKMVKLQTSIRKHFKQNHPTERPFFCKLCTLVFTRERDVNTHKNCLKNRPKDQEWQRIYNQDSIQIYNLNANDIVEEIISYDTASITRTVAEQKEAEEYLGHDDEEEEEKESVSDSEEDVSKCGHCEEDFDTDQDLLDHIQENHPFECPICRRPLKNIDSLRKHGKSAHDGMVITGCKWCVVAFLDPKSKEKHMEEKHNKLTSRSSMENKFKYSNDSLEPLKGLACPVCSREYSVSDSLRKHCRITHNIQVLSCGPCSLTFLNPEAKRLHMTTSDVHKTQANSMSLNESLNSRSANDLTYSCPWCDRSYENGGSLRKHTKKVHAKVAFLCKFCSQVFADLEQRNRHLEVNHDCDEHSSGDQQESQSPEKALKEYIHPPIEGKTCNICQASFGNNEALKAHMSDLHQFMCPVCPKRYKLSKGLREHYRNNHSNVFLDICQTCSRAFVSNQSYKRHLELNSCDDESNQRPDSNLESELEVKPSTELEVKPSTELEVKPSTELEVKPSTSLVKRKTSTNASADSAPKKRSLSGDPLNSRSSSPEFRGFERYQDSESVAASMKDFRVELAKFEEEEENELERFFT